MGAPGANRDEQPIRQLLPHADAHVGGREPRAVRSEIDHVVDSAFAGERRARRTLRAHAYRAQDPASRWLRAECRPFGVSRVDGPVAVHSKVRSARRVRFFQRSRNGRAIAGSGMPGGAGRGGKLGSNFENCPASATPDRFSGRRSSREPPTPRAHVERRGTTARPRRFWRTKGRWQMRAPDGPPRGTVRPRPRTPAPR
jgi:hypothetical protein